MKSKLNIVIFAALNFLATLICLIVIKNPVPISITSKFLVGDLGNKWILICFLFIGLFIPAISFTGKQKTDEQKAFVKRRQRYLNGLFTLWVIITYFFICLFNNQRIIGSRVLISLTSLILIFVACLLSLFSYLFESLAKKDKDVYNLRLRLSIMTAEIAGYVMFVTGVVNIFVDSLILVLLVAGVCLLCVFLVPLIITNVVKKNREKVELLNDSLAREQIEKLDSALNYAATSNVDIDMTSGTIDDIIDEKKENNKPKSSKKSPVEEDTKKKPDTTTKSEKSTSKGKSDTKKQTGTRTQKSKSAKK